MKGFFGFVIVFAILVLLLTLVTFENNFYSSLEKAKIMIIDSEQASKERTILESNIDKIIFSVLEEQVLQENFEIENVKNEVNQKIIIYIKGRAKASTIFFENNKEPTTNFLNENSESLLVEKSGITYAEYVFTGGILRNNTISNNFSKNAKIFFQIPPGYTVRVIG
jgi:hypothetical protein